MKAKPSFASISLCIALLLAQGASSQTIDSRPRRVSLQPASVSKSIAGSSLDSSETATLDAMVPRDGLKFYFEARNGGLAQLARALGASDSLAGLFSLGGRSVEKSKLAGFALRNLDALSASRLALAGYAADGLALLIEAASPADAERLKTEIERLLDSGPGQGDAAGPVVMLRDRRVLAGARASIDRMLESGAASTLADDTEFVKARSRFSDDPFFAYIETGASLMPWAATGGDNTVSGAAYTAGMLAALGSMPYGIAIGGSIEAETTRLRALAIYGNKKKEGLFSSILSAARMGELSAASFAAPDTEIFIDLMIDWEKLYEAIESLFAMVLSSAPTARGNQQATPMTGSADLLAMAEAGLGFSIKNDLIPTLGSEVAISLSGFGDMVRSKPQSSPAASKRTATAPRQAGSSSPRFLLMLSVRDPLKFERLFARLFSPKGGRASQPFAQLAYRGATIHHRKDMAYTITGGFLLAGGTAGEIRRALDSHALNNSLASNPEYSSAMGDPRPRMLQAYLSPAVSGRLFEATSQGAAKRASSPLALSMMSDDDGFLFEMRVPTEIALAALNSLATSKPNRYGISSSPAAGPRRPAGRGSPTLTDDDLKNRRP
ncbi:MAG TPA: DUF3352 domain-containing protein [Blastocatellia bacterium]|nr:DUF3352 domain-containing protein [Blastocatellia bacterium]